MIVAIYARRSTEQRNGDAEAKSTALQIENARAFAKERGWTVAEDHVYCDEAVSGADTRKLHARQRLLDTIAGGPPFGALIMRERSRFSRRDGDEAFGELKRIARAGIQVVFYKDRSTFAFGTFADNVVGFMHAEGAAEYRRQIAAWTYDAMARRARAGFVTGGLLFGYNNVRVDGHVEREINPTHAVVVLEIYTRSAAGEGLKAIAKALNAAGAVAPRPQQSRPSGWSPSSVREVLHRSTYRGLLTWNRTKKRDLEGQHRQHDRPAADWMTTEAEHLRIIPEPLWQAVQARMTDKRASANAQPPLISGRGVRQRYFLAGFGRCAECGGSMQAVSRATSGGRNFRYVCGTYWNRGASVCSNGLMADLPVTDQAVRDHLRDEVLRPRVVERAIALTVTALQQGTRDGSLVERLTVQLAELDHKLANLADTAAKGGAVPAVLTLLAQHDQERRRIAAELVQAQRAGSVPALSAKAIQTRLRGFLGDWDALLEATTVEARSVLDGVLADRIRFTPDREQHRYTLTLPIAFDRVITAALPELGAGLQETMASPRGHARILRVSEHVLVVAAA